MKKGDSDKQKMFLYRQGDKNSGDSNRQQKLAFDFEKSDIRVEVDYIEDGSQGYIAMLFVLDALYGLGAASLEDLSLLLPEEEVLTDFMVEVNQKINSAIEEKKRNKINYFFHT